MPARHKKKNKCLNSGYRQEQVRLAMEEKEKTCSQADGRKVSTGKFRQRIKSTRMVPMKKNNADISGRKRLE